MVGMFCSLKEAAEKLQVNEGEVEAMLRQGTLREFREGPHRLVKAADVRALAQSFVGSRSLVTSPAESSWAPAEGRDMKLPHRAAAVKIPAPGVPRPRNIERRPPREMSTSRRRRPRLASPGRARGRASRPARRTDVPTQDQSVRRWFWNGLIQDRPFTIAILFGTVLLILSAVVAGVYVVSSFVAGL
jgi:excisionase family DNA binding protein